MGISPSQGPNHAVFSITIQYFATLTVPEVQKILTFLIYVICIDRDLIYLFFGRVSRVFLTGRGTRDHGDDFGDWGYILRDFLTIFVTFLAFACRVGGHDYG